jgi:hypothetical protein
MNHESFGLFASVSGDRIVTMIRELLRAFEMLRIAIFTKILKL